jgi:acyl dehydratase
VARLGLRAGGERRGRVSELVTVLDEAPSTGRAYLRALRHLRRPVRSSIVPAIAFERQDVRIDASWLGALHEVFGSAGGGVPLTLPHVLAGGLQLAVVTDEAFPLNIVGAVHVRSEMEQLAPISSGGRFTVRVALEGIDDVERGGEHTLLTELLDEHGERLWVGRSVNLTLDPHAPGKKRRGERPALPEAETSVRFDAPGGIGRRYGAISGDRNPIHMSRYTARLFGFKRAIAHGMWTVGRSLAAMGHPAGGPGDKLTVTFKRPLLLPGEVEVRYGGEEGRFWSINLGEGSVHVEGQLSVAG